MLKPGVPRSRTAGIFLINIARHGIAPGDFRRIIGRAVIDHDDFEI